MIFKSKPLKIMSFPLAGNKASVLNQLCTYYIPIYSVELENA
jgi:hypothetical protein